MRTTCFATPKDAFMNVARGNYDAWPQSGRVRNIMEGERESALAVVIDYVLCSACPVFPRLLRIFSYTSYCTYFILYTLLYIEMQTALLNVLMSKPFRCIYILVYIGPFQGSLEACT